MTDRILVTQSADYEAAIKASFLFSANRLVDEVEDEIDSARLFSASLRSLDVYGPTKKLVEEIIARGVTGDCLRDLESAITGLNILIAARYHPVYSDYRALPALQQYHMAWTLVDKALQKASAQSACCFDSIQLSSSPFFQVIRQLCFLKICGTL